MPHYNDPHFLWSDIQLSKTSTTKNKFTLQINSKGENLQYWLSHCNGMKNVENVTMFCLNHTLKTTAASIPLLM